MTDQVLNVRWRHVHPPKDGVSQIGFTNADTGEVIRMHLSVECQRRLAEAITGYVDAIPGHRQECRAPLNQHPTMG